MNVSFQRRAFEELTPAELHDLLRLRGDVFVVEQGVSSENDIDGRDPECVHVLGHAPDGRLAAAARMHLTDSPVVLSRIVVRRDLRRRGVGTALMEYLHRHLGPCSAVMSAQARLEGFYQGLGWVREGDVYDEVGIPHVRLVRPGRGTEAS